MTSSLLTLCVLVPLVVVLAVRLHRERAAKPDRWSRGVVVVTAVGVATTGVDAVASPPSPVVTALVVGSIALGFGLGCVRGALTRLRDVEGKATRRDPALLIAIWVVGLSAHLAIDVVCRDQDAGLLALASMPLYIGVTYAAQQLVVGTRVRRLLDNASA